MSIQNEGEVNNFLRMGDFILKFEKDENVEEFFSKLASNELRETEELKSQALKELKLLIAEDKNFYLPLDDEGVDLYLLSFLRTCKFYVESALKRLKLLCSFKEKYPEYFANVVPQTERNAFSRNILTILPERDQLGRRLLLLRMGKLWKPRECSLVEIIRGNLLITEGAILEPRTQIAGTVLLLDFEGFGVQQALQFTPFFAKMLLDWMQDAMPLRLKAMHIVSQPYIFNMVFAIFKPFMKGKLRNRIHLHGNNRASLLKHVDANCLPLQYGGRMNLPLDCGLDQWNFLCQYKDDYKKTSQYTYRF